MDFVHWHRNYSPPSTSRSAPRSIGKPDFALPYWNWQSGIGQVPNPFYDLDDLNVVFWNDPSNAQSDNWGTAEVTTTGVRALPEGSGVKQDPQRGGAFTDQNIDSILAQTVFANIHAPARRARRTTTPTSSSAASRATWATGNVAARPDLLAASLQRRSPRGAVAGRRQRDAAARPEFRRPVRRRRRAAGAGELGRGGRHRQPRLRLRDSVGPHHRTRLRAGGDDVAVRRAGDRRAAARLGARRGARGRRTRRTKRLGSRPAASPRRCSRGAPSACSRRTPSR